MSGTGASLNEKIDLAPWGYAPGDQLVACTDCQRIDSHDCMHFLHRHATRCATHALNARQREIHALEGELVPDPDQELADAISAGIRAYSDRFVRIAFIASLMVASCVVASLLFAHP